jgi:hypothetical protein
MPGEPDTDESYMALTFGTLLSSQGADAHRHDPYGQIGGNPRHFTWSVPLGQTPAPAQTPAWSGRSKKIFGPRAWGNARPAPLFRSPLGSPFLRLRPADKRNISRVARREANSVRTQVEPPYFLGSERSGSSGSRS